MESLAVVGCCLEALLCSAYRRALRGRKFPGVGLRQHVLHTYNSRSSGHGDGAHQTVRMRLGGGSNGTGVSRRTNPPSIPLSHYWHWIFVLHRHGTAQQKDGMVPRESRARPRASHGRGETKLAHTCPHAPSTVTSTSPPSGYDRDSCITICVSTMVFLTYVLVHAALCSWTSSWYPYRCVGTGGRGSPRRTPSSDIPQVARGRVVNVTRLLAPQN